MDSIDVALLEAWERVEPRVRADRLETIRRAMRRRSGTVLSRPSRTWCLSIRASDSRLNYWAWVPKYLPREHEPHQITIFSDTLRELCRPVRIDWPGLPLARAAHLLGRTPDAIYLIRLAESRFFAPVIAAIRSAAEAIGHDEVEDGEAESLSGLRTRLRGRLTDDGGRAPVAEGVPDPLDGLVAACRALRFALMTVAGRHFPILLVPGPDVVQEGVRPEYTVQITWDQDAWYLREGNTLLFAFSVPQELLALYQRAGVLRVVDMKAEAFSRFEAVFAGQDRLRLVTFHIDGDWLSQLRASGAE